MVYHSLVFLPFKVPLIPTNLPFMSSMVLDGIERYLTVFNGIELYLNGIPLAGFDNICYY